MHKSTLNHNSTITLFRIESNQNKRSMKVGVQNNHTRSKSGSSSRILIIPSLVISNNVDGPWGELENRSQIYAAAATTELLTKEQIPFTERMVESYFHQ